MSQPIHNILPITATLTLALVRPARQRHARDARHVRLRPAVDGDHDGPVAVELLQERSVLVEEGFALGAEAGDFLRKDKRLAMGGCEGGE